MMNATLVIFVILCFAIAISVLTIKLHFLQKKFKFLEEEFLKTSFVMESLSVNLNLAASAMKKTQDYAKATQDLYEQQAQFQTMLTEDACKLRKEFNEFKTVVGDFSLVVTEQIAALAGVKKSVSTSSTNLGIAKKNDKEKPN